MVATVLVGCGDRSGAPTTTSSTSTSSTSSIPVAPSSVPATATVVCDLLAETVGPDELVPRATSSWRDERERVLVDAQREAGLLRRAAASAPAELVEPLAELADHADAVAEALSLATDLVDARGRLAAIGGPDAVRAADDAVAAWRRTSC